ncbi:MAG: inorganic diphosphatase [Candidatus Aenigmatarchaeota archaeon]
MNLLKDVEIGDKFPEEVNVVIEIPKGSVNKYEYDNEKGVFRLDRVLHSAVFYPADYGFIPQTWFDDNDPIDVLVLVNYPTFPGCVMKARPVALMKMEDEKGTDDKIVMVPVKDPRFGEIKDLDDIPKHIRDEITEFFETMKNLEKGKWVKVKSWGKASEAKKVIERAAEIYKKKFGG